MSTQLGLWGTGLDDAETSAAAEVFRARLGREIAYLLTISHQAGRVGYVSPSGLVHSLGVCLIEDWHMSRGKGKQGEMRAGGGMPRFVDVKLSQEDRKAFLEWHGKQTGLVTHLQCLADDGYRVGVSWSGEHQSYTVSLTGRAEGSANNGLCMTSFAGSLEMALWLALFKHIVVTDGKWDAAGLTDSGDFG